MEVLRSAISLSENMMRESVSERSLEDLVKSIKEVGIINPIVVRKAGEEYELVAGLRRFMAADVLKMEKVLVRVIRAGDERAEKIKMDENKAREDVNPIDEGRYLIGLMEKFGWKQKKVAEKLGVSESYVSQRIGAADWPERLRDVVVNGQIRFSVAREFAGIRDLAEMERVIDQAIRGGCSPVVAARWKHEINRDVIQREQGAGEGEEGVSSELPYEVMYGCEICGTRVSEQEQRLTRVCDNCVQVIKVGQEQGVFKEETQKEGVTPGEQVK